MGLKKFNRWVKSKLHGYELINPIKPKPWNIKPEDKICILAPHADDETIGCGGFLAKFGPQCDVVLLTDGRYGADGSPEDVRKLREHEFAEVMKFFKIHQYSCLGGVDNSLIDAYQDFSKIDFSLYDYVLMPHKYDAHKDHVVPQAFFERLRKEKKTIKARPVYYEVWAAMSCPTHFIDISDVAEVKKKAINMYVSQVKVIDYASRILGLNHYRGIRHNVDFEEDFELG